MGFDREFITNLRLTTVVSRLLSSAPPQLLAQTAPSSGIASRAERTRIGVSGVPTTTPVPPDTSVPTETLGTVSPAGGKLLSSDGRIEIEFPNQAVSQPVEVKYHVRRAAALNRQRGQAIQFDLDAFTADGLKQPVSHFAQPLTLTVSVKGLVDLENLPTDLRPFLAYQADDGRWCITHPMPICSAGR